MLKEVTQLPNMLLFLATLTCVGTQVLIGKEGNNY